MENTNNEIVDEMRIGIGKIESSDRLKPALVVIKTVSVDEIKTAKGVSKKLSCTCSHPEKAEPIKISSVKYESKGKLEAVGLWFNKDSEGNIRKDSALASLLNFAKAATAHDLVGKQIMTTTDEEGYLCFKAY
jgi:hypothetical protein